MDDMGRYLRVDLHYDLLGWEDTREHPHPYLSTRGNPACYDSASAMAKNESYIGLAELGDTNARVSSEIMEGVTKSNAHITQMS